MQVTRTDLKASAQPGRTQRPVCARVASAFCSSVQSAASSRIRSSLPTMHVRPHLRANPVGCDNNTGVSTLVILLQPQTYACSCELSEFRGGRLLFCIFSNRALPTHQHSRRRGLHCPRSTALATALPRATVIFTRKNRTPSRLPYLILAPVRDFPFGLLEGS